MECKKYEIIVDERQKCDDPQVERVVNYIIHRCIMNTYYELQSQPERLNPEDADNSVSDSLNNANT
jgi:hypothetical protein